MDMVRNKEFLYPQPQRKDRPLKKYTPTQDPGPDRNHSMRDRKSRYLLVVCAASIAVAMGFQALGLMAQEEESGKPLLALSPLRLGAGVTITNTVSELMSGRLAQSAAVDLVAPEAMTNALATLSLNATGPFARETARQLRDLTEADYFCSGRISRSGDSSVATLRVVDLSTVENRQIYVVLPPHFTTNNLGHALGSGAEKLIMKFEGERAKTPPKAEPEPEATPESP